MSKDTPIVNSYDSILNNSIEWTEWLESNPSFRFNGESICFLVRLRGEKYWIAYYRTFGYLRQHYLGNNASVNKESLLMAEERLSAYNWKLKRDR